MATKNSTKSKSKNGLVAFQAWGSLATIIFGVLLLIMFVVPAFEYNYNLLLLNLNGSVSFYDLFNGSAGYQALMSFLIIFISWIIIDNIIKLCVEKLRTNLYAVISNVIQVIVTIIMIVMFIVLSALVLKETGVGILVGYFFVIVFLTAFCTFSLAMAVLNVKKIGLKR